MRDEDVPGMDLAIAEALAAERAGDAPIGAVLIRAGEVIGRGRNAKTTDACGLRHAELNALLGAAPRLGRRPEGVTLYATLEPCAMCLGAAIFAGVRRVVYGAPDPLGGAVALLSGPEPYRSWMPEVVGGVRERECAELRERAQRRGCGPSGAAEEHSGHGGSLTCGTGSETLLVP